MNIYCKNNPQYFQELLELATKYPHSYFSMLKAKYVKSYGKSISYLYNWILSQTSAKLDVNVHKLSTMVNWILNGITDFPKCSMCGNQFGKKLKLQLNAHYSDVCPQCAKRVSGIKASQIFVQKQKDDPLYFKKIDEKRKLTSFMRHGDPNWNNKEKSISTCIKKYGVDNVRKTSMCKEKIKQTKKRHYGNENFVNVEKQKQTCLAHYGCERAMQSPEIRAKAKTKYQLDGNSFDSKIELCYYIWLRDNNKCFKFKPNVAFKYIFNEKQHFYFPDFYVDGCYIELKGNHFFKEDGTMQNPYDHRQDLLYEAKHQCMLENNVKIIRQSECKIYIDFVALKYGSDFCKKCKNLL